MMITVENPGDSRNENMEYVEVALPNFNVIVVQEGARVQLNTNDSCNIKYSHKKDALKEIPYQLLTDTLILKPAKSGDRNFHYTINLKLINALIVEGGNVDVNLRQDSILVTNSQKGNVNVFKNSSFKHLQLEANEKSRSNIYTANIKSLMMHVNNAEVFSNTRISSVNLDAENKANITLQHVKKLTVNCDSTSTYRIY